MNKAIHPLRRWLFERQETATAFSERAGIATSYLSEVLNGIKRPSLDTIDKITVATNGEITANDFQQFTETQETS
jgi:transcriptional regulator with XRE-family HTH domain